jgi:hypothetical protein
MLNRDLPTGYTSLATLNLMQQRWLKVGLSLASLVLILPVSLVLFYLTQWLRPAVLTVWTAAPPVDVPPDGFSFLIPISWLIGFLAASVLIIPLHELVHGLLFWVFTRRRPLFGLRLPFYAFAAAPVDVYLPRNPYLVVALAPLVLLNLLGLLLLPIMPLSLVPTLVLFMLLNTVGAVGDLLVTGWLLHYPARVVVQDVGDTMTVYGAK